MDSVLLEYMEQALDVFQDGIWISDADSTCLFVNKKYEELSGFSRKWMVGRKATSIVAEGVFDVAVNPEVVSSGKPVSKIQTLSNGRHLSLDGFPIVDSDGRVVMCITFIRDISTIVDMENKLAHQRDLLNTLVRLASNSCLQGAEDGSNFIFSPAMEAFLSKARIMAQTDISILVLGETGVGKDVMAQRIHAMSRRAEKPFIKVDCGSIAPSLIESELFGYIGGAFSGASRSGRIGLIEAAAGGTVFFDEIGELPLALQTRLLRFLQDGVIVRVGSNTPKKVDVRVIAATNKDLEKAVAKGEFRSDLYYRLKIAVLNVPPLRRRKDDIMPLAQFFLRYFSRKYNRAVTMGDDVEELLLSYDWPGNVRELRSMMQEAVVTCPKNVVKADNLPIRRAVRPREPSPSETEFDFEGRDYHDIMREMECRMLRAAIARCSGNMTAASRMLRMDRSTMFRKIRELERHGLKVL
ncbi:sigma 54-interacting transcriptional regulator [uncultured Mailhella sp.]|uniref:sigma-54 interaction domain-containing protein n=1 Tax=uncultured Mailhella sp. TaxID=1981031 RepID=UPI0025ED5D73|nr:sigma 54-interacting transcriptional regulator [uncultured Mailhella sp.]